MGGVQLTTQRVPSDANAQQYPHNSLLPWPWKDHLDKLGATNAYWNDSASNRGADVFGTTVVIGALIPGSPI